MFRTSKLDSAVKANNPERYQSVINFASYYGDLFNRKDISGDKSTIFL
jgi:hypothetical protein